MNGNHSNAAHSDAHAHEHDDPALDLITFADACKLIGVSTVTGERWLRDPRKDFIRPFRVGNQRLYRRRDVLAYINKKADEALAGGACQGVALSEAVDLPVASPAE